MIAPDGTAYDLVGSDDGPPVALIHGLGLCRRVWDGLLPAFAGFRVLNYDLHGHGQGGPPSSEPTLRLFADQLARLMDHVGMARSHVVGFSIGGMINRRFALDHPDRVASLVILNSPHDRGEDAQIAVEARARRVQAEGALATMDAALKRWFTPAYLEKGEGVGLVRNWRLQVDPAGYAGAAWVLANGVRELIAPEPPIKAPSLVMTCENDSGSTPSMSRAIAAEIPGAALEIVPGLRHLGLMEDPDAFSAPIRRFIEGRGA